MAVRCLQVRDALPGQLQSIVPHASQCWQTQQQSDDASGIPARWLSEADAAAGIWHKHRSYVTAAWRFLHDHGYINFGVAPAIHAAMLASQPTRGTVVIIGAGMAGVLCVVGC